MSKSITETEKDSYKRYVAMMERHKQKPLPISGWLRNHREARRRGIVE